MADLLHSFASTIPSISKSRSKFMRPYDHITSFNLGEIVPFYLDEIVPGDTCKIDTSLVARLTSLVKPIFGNIVLDTYYFFVPSRLVWKHFKEFWGENTQGAWTENLPTYTIPLTVAPEGGFKKGSLADHFGLPLNIAGYKVSSLPFRAYTLIYNDFFRDQNTQRPLYLYDGDADTTSSAATAPYAQVEAGVKLAQACKFKDYFTSALPGPQRGDPVTIEFVNSGLIPVVASNANYHSLGDTPRFGTDGPDFNDGDNYYLALGESGQTVSNIGDLKKSQTPAGSSVGMAGVTGTNLMVQLSGTEAISINALRNLFALQRCLEHLSLSGNRYIEVLQGLYGVNCPDYRLQRPEYLGGQRTPINVQQVAQTSATVEDSPAANLTAYSHTADSGHSFTKSFTEHGYIIGLAVARLIHVYGSQGISKMWTRSQRFEFYTPTFANIGEQPILRKELVYTGTDTDDDVFGYQEAWADYRVKNSDVTGSVRPNSGSEFIPSWSTSDYYETQPILNEEFMLEDPAFLDRSLVYSHEVADQFVVDFYVKGEWSRLMPLYSVPGLIDHY